MHIRQITEYSKEYISVRGGGYYHLRAESGATICPKGYQEGTDPYVRRRDSVSSVTFPVASIPAIIETGIDIAPSGLGCAYMDSKKWIGSVFWGVFT